MTQAVNSPNAPAAIGPYSQAVMTQSLLFISGQLPVDPISGQLEEDDIKKQTHRSLQNIRAILEQADATMGQVVKTTVYLRDMKDFAMMNEVYAEYFSSEPQPARAAVQVAALPKDVRVEIEAIAVK